MTVSHYNYGLMDATVLDGHYHSGRTCCVCLHVRLPWRCR